MKIVCPACASQYELDAAKLGPDGRKVRCAACKTLWHVEPAPDLPEPPSAEETQAMLNEELARTVMETQGASEEPPVEIAPESTLETTPAPPPAPAAARKRSAKSRRKAASRPIGERLRGAAIPLAICGVGMLILGLAAWQRELAVRAAPQLAGVFETLGLPVNIRGLALTAVESGVVDDGQGRFLIVEGDVANIRRGVVPLPAIEVLVKDASGQTLYTWTTDPPRPSLEPAELVRFRARLAQPPENGRSVQVRFASAKPPALANAR